VSHPDAPEALKKHERLLMMQEPQVNPWICVILLGITVALVAVTAQFLVDSVEPLRLQGHIGDE
jgi:Ca2+:H+ antiporter